MKTPEVPSAYQLTWSKFFLLTALIMINVFIFIFSSSKVKAQPRDRMSQDLMVGNIVSDAQTYNVSNNYPLLANDYKNEVSSHMQCFNARVAKDTVYLNLLVQGETEKSDFVFQRSVNGNEYTIVDMHDGYPAPDKSALQYYSAKDSDPTRGNIIYRVMQIKQSGVFFSQPAVVYISN